MIDATKGEANHVINSGEINSAGAYNYSSSTVIKVGGAKSQAINYKTINILGAPPNAADDVSLSAIRVQNGANGVNAGTIELVAEYGRGIYICKGGAANGTNEGTINVNTLGGLGIYVTQSEGAVGINTGTITVNDWDGSTSDSDLGGGMRARTTYVDDKTATTNVTVINQGTIEVLRQNSFGLLLGGDQAVPPLPPVSAKGINRGIIKVIGKGSSGMESEASTSILDNTEGLIKTSSDTYGIRIDNDIGELVHTGHITGDGTAVYINGNFENKSKKLVFKPGTYLEGPYTIRTKEAGGYPIYLQGGTYKGDIAAGNNTVNTLYIQPENPAPPIANGAVNIQGDISGFPTVDVSGSGWTVEGWIRDATTLKNGSSLSKVYVSDKAPLSNKIAETGQLSLKFTTATEPLSIKRKEGTDGTIDSLFIQGKAKLKDVEGVNKLVVNSKSDWNLSGSVKDLSTLKISGKVDKVGVGIDTSTSTNTISLQFTNRNQEDLKVINRGGKVETVDFSPPADLSYYYRPVLKYAQHMGSTKSIKGMPGKGDEVHLHKGTIKGTIKGITDVDHLYAINNVGDDWSVPAVITGVREIHTETGKTPDNIRPYAIKKVVLANPATMDMISSKSNTLWLTADNPAVPVSFSSDREDLIESVEVYSQAHFGRVQGAESLVIQGSDWEAHNSVEDAAMVNIEPGGTVDTIALGSGAPSVGSLNLSFKKTYEPYEFVTITNANSTSGSVKNVDFSTDTDRPNLKYVQDGGNADVKIQGHPEKIDIISMQSGEAIEKSQYTDISGFEYTSGNVPHSVQDLKYLGLLPGSYTFSTIEAKRVSSTLGETDANIMSVDFSDNMPGHFYLNTAADTVGTIDFTLPDRPDTTLILSGGTVNEYKGTSTRNDDLALLAGTLGKGTEYFQSIKVFGDANEGEGWTANGLFTQVNQVEVFKQGSAKVITVGSGVDLNAWPKGKGNLNIQTLPGKPVSIDVNEFGSLGKISLTNGSYLTTSHLQGDTTVEVASPNWQAGHFVNAGKLDAKKQANIDRFYVSGTDFPVPLTNSLYFITQDYPLAVTGSAKVMELREGAMLANVEGVENVEVYGAAKSALSAPPASATTTITDAKTLIINSPFQKVHVGNAVLPEHYESLDSFLSMNTAKTPLTIEGSERIKQLHISDGAKLNKVSSADNMHIFNGTWSFKSAAEDLQSVTVEEQASVDQIGTVYRMPAAGSGTAQSLPLKFNSANGEFVLTNKGNITQAHFSDTGTRPKIRYVHDGTTATTSKVTGRADDILVFKNGAPAEYDGFRHFGFEGTGWGSKVLSNPKGIEIGDSTEIALIMDKPLIAPASDSELSMISAQDYVLTEFIAPSGQALASLPTMTVTSKGGHVKTIDYSDTVRPKLVVHQRGGRIDKIIGSPGFGDELILESGQTGEVKDIEKIQVAASDWQAGTIYDPSSITINKLVVLPELTTVPQTTQEMSIGKLSLAFKPPVSTLLGSTVTVTSSGLIENINLQDNTDRPAIHIVQQDGITNKVKARSGYGDTMEIRGSGIITGNIEGLDSLTFSGTDTQFIAPSIATAGSINVTGKLTLPTGQTVAVTPGQALVSNNTTVHIQKSGTLSSPADTPTDTPTLPATRPVVLEVTGLYKQDGRLEVPMDNRTDRDTPYIKATKIEIGSDAVVYLNIQDDINKDQDQLLMEATAADINAAPNVQAANQRYTHYYAQLAAKKLFVSNMDMGHYISDLAITGKANESAIRAITTAVDPKGNTGSNPQQLNDSDPLNTWTLTQCNQVNENPVEVAKIANQMTPDLSGASIGSAQAAYATGWKCYQ